MAFQLQSSPSGIATPLPPATSTYPALAMARQTSQGPNAIGRLHSADHFALTLEHPHAPTDLEDRIRNGKWGPLLFDAAKQAPRSFARRVQDRLFDGMMADENTKRRTIALLDALTAVPPARYADYLHQFFPRTEITARGLLGVALRLGTARWVPQRLVRWGLERMLRDMGRRFLAGSNATEALATAARLREHGMHTTLDVVTENVVSRDEAVRYNDRVTDVQHASGPAYAGEPYTAGGVIDLGADLNFFKESTQLILRGDEH